jgi:hypothetical protein
MFVKLEIVMEAVKRVKAGQSHFILAAIEQQLLKLFESKELKKCNTLASIEQHLLESFCEEISSSRFDPTQHQVTKTAKRVVADHMTRKVKK